MWGRKARQTPRPLDLLLVEALQLYEESLCSCGHSALLSYDEMNDDEFELSDETYCYACKVAESDKAKDLAEDKPPGLKIAVRNTIDEPGRRF